MNEETAGKTKLILLIFSNTSQGRLRKSNLMHTITLKNLIN